MLIIHIAILFACFNIVNAVYFNWYSSGGCINQVHTTGATNCGKCQSVDYTTAGYCFHNDGDPNFQISLYKDGNCEVNYGYLKYDGCDCWDSGLYSVNSMIVHC